ncbi:ABC transporter ATP-binding protein [Neobacillus sp. D3-1R]|uniref:ABC transporter ATP-binding protein n=1 Tax=Neobacillus sp. D3-1R TaxID=3445778 RepID=UPI003FA13A47
MAVIEIKNVTFTYPNADRPALRNISLNVEKGQFIVLFGSSGSGKSTLLRLLKKDIQPHGELKGEILIEGNKADKSVCQEGNIGFVFQDPENQVVADDVLHEIVFGLENLGLSTNEMRGRVAEMVHYFGLEPLLHRKTNELSGGMKQHINLASVLLMQPNILLLDEPTAQLDPVSAKEFLDMLVRLNEEFGMTIILAEHRLEEILTISDKIVLMENGEVKAEGEPRKVLSEIWESSNRPFIPTIPSLYFSATKKDERNAIPLTVKEGKSWLINQKIMTENTFVQPFSGKYNKSLLEVKDVFFRYNREEDFVLTDLQFSLKTGEFYALLGGNGSGKSTLLKMLTGILKPTQGKILLHNKPLKSYKSKELAKKIGYLPQNPKLFFIHDTVEKEIQKTMELWGLSNHDEARKLIENLGINHVLSNHPYDLSGGELQKASLACLLLREPEILILDEPTKGLDPISKENLSNILVSLQKKGITILMSTHDVEFAAAHASRCGMMFQGNITSENNPRKFFNGNFFYTTMVQRLFRHLPDSEVVTLQEAISVCEKTIE